MSADVYSHMPRHRFSLKTLFWLMAAVALWLSLFSLIRADDPYMRLSTAVCLTGAFIGAGCLVAAARLKIGDDWRLGAAQLGAVMAGIVLLAASGLFSLWICWACYAC